MDQFRCHWSKLSPFQSMGLEGQHPKERADQCPSEATLNHHWKVMETGELPDDWEHPNIACTFQKCPKVEQAVPLSVSTRIPFLGV